MSGNKEPGGEQKRKMRQEVRYTERGASGSSV